MRVILLNTAVENTKIFHTTPWYRKQQVVALVHKMPRQGARTPCRDIGMNSKIILEVNAG